MATVEEIRRRFRDDGAFYAEHALRIPNEDGEIVQMAPRRGQLKIEAAIQAQQAANRPIRILILKSRRLGSSTWAVATLLRRLTQRENRKGQIVAQDSSTASELFSLAKSMYQFLPDEPWLKPPVYRANDTKDTKLLWWGEQSRFERDRGNLGINSQLTIDTAGVIQAGRGKTIHDLLCTEVAFWSDPMKALSLLNAVYDRPDTCIILESTANGFNWFKDRWDRAMRGESAYQPVFIGWTEDENAVRPFDSEEDRERFIASIGTGPWGEDEPRLVEQHGATPEQLHWRRRTIEDKTEGKLELFDQEYPSDAARAFVGSGKHVFSITFVQQVLDRVERIEQLPPAQGGPMTGIFTAAESKPRRTHDGELDVPTKAAWVPSDATGFPMGHDFWLRWNPVEDAPHEPEDLLKPPDSQFIAIGDPASGEENTSGDSDFHAIQVIDHRTRQQVARLETRRLDPDELAYQLLLAALFFKDALISVETTGGYGVPVVRKLWDGYGWRRIYKRKAVEQSAAKTTDRLGWDTNRRTKPLMIAGMTELLREGTDGIRDVRTALQMTTYVTDVKGRQGADAGAFDDLLTSYMQGQEVARETRLRPDGPSGITTTWMRRPR
jgi:hypothetical protein